MKMITYHNLEFFADTWTHHQLILVFISHFYLQTYLQGGGSAGLGAFRAFVRFVLVWVCRFPLPLGVWEWLRFVIVALPGLFSYLFLLYVIG